MMKVTTMVDAQTKIYVSLCSLKKNARHPLSSRHPTVANLSFSFENGN